MSVEAEPGFESQRVAGAQPDRLDRIVGEKAAREGLDVAGRDGNLVAVFAGVTGSRYLGGEAVERDRAHAHEAHRLDASIRREPRQDLRRGRSLQGDESGLGADSQFDMGG